MSVATHRVLLSACLVAACLPAHAVAQALYRCEEGGRVAYGDVPCAGAARRAAVLRVDPGPDPETTLQARREAAAERDRLEARVSRDRAEVLERERIAAQRRATAVAEEAEERARRQDAFMQETVTRHGPRGWERMSRVESIERDRAEAAAAAAWAVPRGAVPAAAVCTSAGGARRGC